MSGYIYALCDPNNGEVRYIGQTSSDLVKRLRGHISSAKRGSKWHNANWIRSLMQDGLKPVIKLIEELDTDDLNKREEYWIDYYRQQGCKLTNYGIGGGAHRKYDEPIGSSMYRFLKQRKMRLEQSEAERGFK